MKNIWEEIVPIYYTENLDKTNKFYIGLLEFEIFEIDEGTEIYCVKNGFKIGFCIKDELVADKNATQKIIIKVSDIDIVYAHITSSGYTIPPLPLIDERTKIESFSIKDPNGYIIEFRTL